jgi:hypothetical protein
MEDTRRRTVFDTPINPEMGEGRYQDTLRRIRGRIAAGLPLDLDDSNTIGDKHTHASWGLCTDDARSYPDVNDHVFPEQVKAGRSSPRDPPKQATCPFDRGRFKPDSFDQGHSGCFYRCMLFNPVKGQLPVGEPPVVRGDGKRVGRPPTKDEALKLYDGLIAQREAKFGVKTTKDDNESHWEPR